MKVSINIAIIKQIPWANPSCLLVYTIWTSECTTWPRLFPLGILSNCSRNWRERKRTQSQCCSGQQQILLQTLTSDNNYRTSSSGWFVYQPSKNSNCVPCIQSSWTIITRSPACLRLDNGECKCSANTHQSHNHMNQLISYFVRGIKSRESITHEVWLLGSYYYTAGNAT